jgi:DNA-binding transcriptional ArsR family regulator
MPDLPSRTVSDSMEETKDRHRRYLRAINNPVRRKILRSIKDGNHETASISLDTGIDEKTVGWHIRVLIDGFCVEASEDETKYLLTQEGLVVDYLDK